MPTLTSGSYEDALAQLIALGIDKVNINKTEQFSDKEAGQVIEQTPAAGTKYDAQSVKVILVVSKGKEDVRMTNLIGMTQEKAEAALKGLDLKLSKDGIKYESSFEHKEGVVIDQWPFKANDTVTPGSEVILTVSSGYPPEAIEYKFSFPVVPATEGKKSKIKIVFGDARGEKQDWGTKTISGTEMISVDMILAPNKDGVVTVTRDGQYLDAYPVSYIDVKQGTVPIPQIPGTEAPESGGNSLNNPEDATNSNTDTNGQ
ncbi:Serine/threonine-protein kinase PrkC [compost metagenome]